MTAIKLVLITLLLPLLLTAQKLPLMMQGKAPRFYLEHQVGPKENYYSIGRLYNCSPSLDIAPFNNLDMKDGLKIGQQIMIPLQENNYSGDGKSAAGEVLVPIYSQVGKGESLNIMSSRYQVTSARLKSWNALEKDQLAVGKKLVVGYLKIKKDLSSLASSSVNVSDVSETVPEPAPKTDVVSAPPKEKVKSESVKTDSVKKEIQKEADRDIPTKLSGGYFKSQFEKQMKGKTSESIDGTAGIFKSSSGWDDGKYYCLFNSTQAGNIIRITNPSNQRSVYAKVLDAIPDMKQNEGIILRLSNAAASELGVTDGKFQCEIRY